MNESSFADFFIEFCASIIDAAVANQYHFILKKILHITILVAVILKQFHFECLVDVLSFLYPTARGSSCFVLVIIDVLSYLLKISITRIG